MILQPLYWINSFDDLITRHEDLEIIGLPHVTSTINNSVNFELNSLLSRIVPLEDSSDFDLTTAELHRIVSGSAVLVANGLYILHLLAQCPELKKVLKVSGERRGYSILLQFPLNTNSQHFSDIYRVMRMAYEKGLVKKWLQEDVAFEQKAEKFKFSNETENEERNYRGLDTFGTSFNFLAYGKAVAFLAFLWEAMAYLNFRVVMRIHRLLL